MSKEMREQIDRIKNWKQFLNENVNVLPQYLYHITSSENFEGIKNEGGLKPEYSKQSKGEKGIYLTDDISVAKNYSNFYDDGTELVLLRISTNGMDLSKFSSDDYELQDFLNDGGWGSKDKRIREYSKWYNVPWELSLLWVNQVQYHKLIPIENIEVIDRWIH
jgi:hypothetical protein